MEAKPVSSPCTGCQFDRQKMYFSFSSVFLITCEATFPTDLLSICTKSSVSHEPILALSLDHPRSASSGMENFQLLR